MIIGLTGKLQSGKTTTANYISEEYPTHLLAFADLLKEMIYNAGLCSREELWGKKTDFSRLMMQKIGTEIIRRQVDENFWINKMNEKIGKILNDERIRNLILTLIVVHDVRFLNEAKCINDNKGIMIRVIRPLLETEENNFSKHASEVEQDLIKADYTILNDGDLFKLKKTIAGLINNILIKR